MLGHPVSLKELTYESVDVGPNYWKCYKLSHSPGIHGVLIQIQWSLLSDHPSLQVQDWALPLLNELMSRQGSRSFWPPPEDPRVPFGVVVKSQNCDEPRQWLLWLSWQGWGFLSLKVKCAREGVKENYWGSNPVLVIGEDIEPKASLAGFLQCNFRKLI